ncbi:MAG: hypothetical protein ACREEB_12790 [Caulobacteraceae bacterium]
MLTLGAVVGFAITAPIVAGYAVAYAWIAAPLVVAYSLWIWFRGWRLIATDDEDDDPRPARRAFYVAVGLFWTFVGGTLLIFLARLALANWPAVAAAFALLAVLAVVALIVDRMHARPSPDRTIVSGAPRESGPIVDS